MAYKSDRTLRSTVIVDFSEIEGMRVPPLVSATKSSALLRINRKSILHARGVWGHTSQNYEAVLTELDIFTCVSYANT
jgi:hypothetical protein